MGLPVFNYFLRGKRGAGLLGMVVASGVADAIASTFYRAAMLGVSPTFSLHAIMAGSLVALAGGLLWTGIRMGIESLVPHSVKAKYPFLFNLGVDLIAGALTYPLISSKLLYKVSAQLDNAAFEHVYYRAYPEYAMNQVVSVFAFRASKM